MSAGRAARALLEHCRALPGATEDVKWENNLVFSVGGKMFCVFGLPELETVSFKTDPDTFDGLVERPGVAPAPYLARYSWVLLESLDALPGDFVGELIDRSHQLVASKLPARARAELGIG